jgi:hypothetical protein
MRAYLRVCYTLMHNKHFHFDKGHTPFLYPARCLLKDERQRWSADRLLEHQFVKSPVEHGLSPQRSTEEKKVEECRQQPCLLWFAA